MVINCVISIYEAKQVPSDPAPGVGTSSFDILMCARSFGIYSQRVNRIVVVILCRRYPTIPQEYLGKVTFFLFKGYWLFLTVDSCGIAPGADRKHPWLREWSV